MIRDTEPRDEDLQLNMAPLIDMVFLLIIFFLTATSFTQMEREQEVLLPRNSNPGSLSRQSQRSLVVNVFRDGRLRLGGRDTSLEELEGRVREQAGTLLKVLVRADRRAPYGSVALALAAVERGGVQRPSLVARVVDLEE